LFVVCGATPALKGQRPAVVQQHGADLDAVVAMKLFFGGGVRRP
jgi:hypothetical protein